MIYGNVNELEQSSAGFDQKLKACFDYVRENDLLSFAPGRYDIEGDDLFVNIVEYETTQPENRFWEAHRYYLDLHVMLRGAERIDLNLIEKMDQETFVEKDDFLPLQGEAKAHVVLEPGDYLVCDPQDAHRTAVISEKPEPIKKAIFKIKR